MVQDTPSRKLDQYIVRFPDGMRDKLKEIAASNNRSLNAEIVSRLEQSLELAKLVDDYRMAEERLMEQAKTERDLRRQIELLETNLADVKAGREIDLGNEAVQKAMIDQVQAVMSGVIADMREEHRLTNGLHLLLEWFATNPEERAEYEALPLAEREEFAREKTHALWIEHLNAARAGRTTGVRRPAIVQPPARPKSKRDQSSRVANDDPILGTLGGVSRSPAAAPEEPADDDKTTQAAKTPTRGQKPPKGSL